MHVNFKFFMIGFRGPSCGLSCWAQSFGQQCLRCDCHNGAGCDPLTGACVCGAGWTGKKCAQPCGPGTYGMDCKQKCRCENGAECDPISGQCKCLSGYYGKKFSADIKVLNWLLLKAKRAQASAT